MEMTYDFFYSSLWICTIILIGTYINYIYTYIIPWESS